MQSNEVKSCLKKKLCFDFFLNIETINAENLNFYSSFNNKTLFNYKFSQNP